MSKYFIIEVDVFICRVRVAAREACEVDGSSTLTLALSVFFVGTAPGALGYVFGPISILWFAKELVGRFDLDQSSFS